MKKTFFIFLLAALWLAACGKPATPPPTATALPPTTTPTFTPTPHPTAAGFMTVTPVCISPIPAQNDINHALAFADTAFNPADWEKSYTVFESIVAVTRQNVVHGALAYIELRIEPCGYDEPDLNRDFSAANWQAIFANYESYQSIAECRTDTGLRLYQFKTQNQGLEYAINYWVKSDTDTRVIVTMLVFPIEELALLGTYSAQLFPDLPNCS
jgi:hypothetical protein